MNNFIIEIEKLKEEKKINYIDAIVLWCEINLIEIEVAADLIKKDQTLKTKLQLEAEGLRILKSSGATLPI